MGGFNLPDGNAAAHRVISNAKIFRKIGYNVVFLGVTHHNLDFETSKTNHLGFESYSIPYPKTIKSWFRYLTDIDEIRELLHRYQDTKFVIAYNTPSVFLSRLNNLCQNKNIRVISDCTEWYSAKGYGIFAKTIKNLDSFYRMRYIHKKLDGLIVISSYLKDYYQKHVNLIQLPPLIDLDDSKWEKKSKNDMNGKIKFVYSGYPAKSKDKLDTIIEMFSRLESTNYILNIVGLTAEEYVDIFPSHRHRQCLSKLSQNIVFSGRLNHLESLEVLKDSDFSIFFRDNQKSNKAGFPTKFVESITSGVPVITNLTSDLEQYLIEGVNGFTLDEISMELNTKKINTVIKMPYEVIEKMKFNALSTKLFDYRNHIDTVENFINGYYI